MMAESKSERILMSAHGGFVEIGGVSFNAESMSFVRTLTFRAFDSQGWGVSKSFDKDVDIDMTLLDAFANLAKGML